MPNITLHCVLSSLNGAIGSQLFFFPKWGLLMPFLGTVCLADLFLVQALGDCEELLKPHTIYPSSTTAERCYTPRERQYKPYSSHIRLT